MLVSTFLCFSNRQGSKTSILAMCPFFQCCVKWAFSLRFGRRGGKVYQNRWCHRPIEVGELFLCIRSNGAHAASQLLGPQFGFCRFSFISISIPAAAAVPKNDSSKEFYRYPWYRRAEQDVRQNCEMSLVTKCGNNETSPYITQRKTHFCWSVPWTCWIKRSTEWCL